MALNDKNLIITPNIGSTNDPKIDFIGASATVGPSTITATIYSTNNGTLSFDGTAGSLFSISNNLSTGSIFSVNPISGIPIIDVNADRTIALNPYGGNTGIGTISPSQKLHVAGNLRVTGAIYDSNNSAGTNNQVLKSTGVGVTWVGGSGSGIDADLLDGLNSATTNTPSTIVARDASGNFSAGTITAALTGNATTATTATNVSGGTVSATTGAFSGVVDFTAGSSGVPAIRIKSSGSNWAEGFAVHPATDNNFALAFFRTRASLTDTTNTWAIGNLAEGTTNNFGLLRFGLTGSAGIRADSPFDVTQAGVFRFGFTPTVGSNAILHAGNYNNYAPTLTGTGASGTWGINVTGSSASSSGNASTATTLQTTRTIWGQNFNGGANVSGALTGATDITASGTIKGNQIVGGTGSAIGSAGLIVNGTTGDNDSQLIIKKPSQSAFSVLSWDGAVYLASNIYYNNGGWVQSAPTGNNNNQMLTFSPGTGVRWYASNNGSGSWNVASDLQLWSDAGVWQRPLSNTLTLNTSGTGLSGSTTFNNSGAATFTVTSNATNANTGSTIVARDASGNFSAGTITAALTGNATTATNLSTNRTNWSTNGTITAVVGQLAWKNYSNNHTIFDASAGTSPAGGAVNNTTSQVAWTGTYPTLMGWNGTNTYGVRVDVCRLADTATTATNVSGGSVSATTGGFSGTVSATAYTSTVATGTAPLTVSSTTKVTNLNADLLDGVDSTAFKRVNDQTQVNVTAPASTTGTWTSAGVSDEWGNPKFDTTFNAYTYGDAPSTIQFNVPAGMKSAWISQLTWSTGGYVDVHGVQSGGQLVFLRRINTRQSVENTDEGVNHDGSTVTFAASGLDDYSAIRFTVKSGRFHFTGLSFSSADNEGTEGVGMVHPAQISHQGAGSGLDADTVDGLNPSTSGTSNIVSRDGSGNFSAGTITAGLTITNTDIRSNAASNWTGDPGTQGKIQYHSSRWYIVADSSSDRIVQFRRNGTDVSYIQNDGTFNGSITGNAATATTTTNVSGGSVSATTGGFSGTVSATAYTSTVATGTAPLTVSSTTKVTNLNADLFDDVDSITRSASHRANRNISGGGTITVDIAYNVLWSNRFIVISNGFGSNFSTVGYFDITCPVSGTIIGVGGAGNVTATAVGIPLGAWQALYYILPIGSNNGSLAANFRVASHTSALDIPHNWVLICVRNADTGAVTFNNGITLTANQSMNSLQQSNTNTANTLVRRDGSGNFSAGTITAAALTVSGNLTVNGTTTTINSTTLTIDDKNIELGSVASPTDVTADGGGITLKGTTDKTLNWVSSTAAWTSSEDFNLATGKVYEIAGTTVLSASQVLGKTLPSGVIVGTTDTQTLTNKTIAAGSNTISGLTNSNLSGTAGITNANLANSTISGVSLGSNLSTLTMNVSGTGLSGSTTYNGSGAATFTVTINATSANTASTVVARDASGNFSAGAITATNYLVTTASSAQASGATIQRVFTKSVAAGQLYQLATYNDNEGTVAFEIQVSSGTGGNSGTSTYRFQGGFSALPGSYYRLYPFNDGRGHGDSADTGLDSNAWNVFIYGTTVTGSSYTYGIAVHVPTGRTGKSLITTIKELKRGMAFSDQSANAVITTFTNSGNIYSHRNLIVESRIGVGKVPTTAIDVNGTVTATTFSGPLTGNVTGNVSGSSGSCTGNSATATTATNLTGLTLNSIAAPINPDNVTQNQIGYNTNVSLFGQSDGGLYSSAYSSSWIHQIYGDFRTGQIAIRGKNNGTWQAWRSVLDSSNYNSYAPTLTGTGASGTWGINITGNAATSSNTSSISNAVGGGYTWTGVQYFRSNLGATSGALSNPPLQAYATGSNAAFMSFHRGGAYAVNMGLDSDNIFRIGGWSAPANRLQMDMSGNLTMAGTVAGTNITAGGNVTGSSASVANVVTFNNGGAGDASGTTFNGSAARTISHNTLGASPLAGSTSLVTTGTVTTGTWSGSFGAVSGANLTSLNASNLSSGTVATARLGSGTANNTTYLRGDNTWATVSGGSTITVADDTTTNATRYIVFEDVTSGTVSTVNVSSTKLIFNPSTGTLSVSGNLIAYSSDRRLKENLNHIESPLEKVQKLNGYTFDWNEKSKELGFIPKHEKNDIGLIAQEVEEVLPQATARAPFDLDTNGESKSGENYLTIQYERIVPLLVEAIKEQQETINMMKEEIEILKLKMVE